MTNKPNIIKAINRSFVTDKFIFAAKFASKFEKKAEKKFIIK